MENIFLSNFETTLEVVRQVLDITRNPQNPTGVSHSYADKYLLAEFLTNMAISTLVNSLESLGLLSQQLKEIFNLARNKLPMTLRLKLSESCSLVEERDVEESRADDTNTNNVIKIFGRNCSTKLKTSTKVSPRYESKVYHPIDVDITWLISHISTINFLANFQVNRSHSKCHTPRRNEDISQAIDQCLRLIEWSKDVCAFLLEDLFRRSPDNPLDLTTLTHSRDVFVPILPILLFQQQSSTLTTDSSQELSPMGTDSVMASTPENRTTPSQIPDSVESSAILAEHHRSLYQCLSHLEASFPPAASPGSTNNVLISFEEAKLLKVVQHIGGIGEQYVSSVGFIESMLRAQLVAAIGKNVTAQDFSEYMDFHVKKLFREKYSPRTFCYPVRRSVQHCLEGIVSVGWDGAGSSGLISTSVSYQPSNRGISPGNVQYRQPVEMYFQLNAATRIAFTGDRYLHSWLSHRFSSSVSRLGDTGYKSGADSVELSDSVGGHVTPPSLLLTCHACPWSSFIVLLGRIGSATEFVPKYGFLASDRDEYRIPIDIEQIPSAKEFADAIESLSPEQQRFAKAYRTMQLESTLFGICVIQIKPQLEAVLKLPDDSLTKEIRLSHDLMALFTEYNIPSDLLLYDGPSNGVSVVRKVDVVKENVRAVQSLIQDMKRSELDGQKQRAEYEQNLHSPSSPYCSHSTSDAECEEDECDTLCELEDQSTVLTRVEVLPIMKEERRMSTFSSFRKLLKNARSSLPLPSNQMASHEEMVNQCFFAKQEIGIVKSEITDGMAVRKPHRRLQSVKRSVSASRLKKQQVEAESPSNVDTATTTLVPSPSTHSKRQQGEASGNAEPPSSGGVLDPDSGLRPERGDEMGEDEEKNPADMDIEEEVKAFSYSSLPGDIDKAVAAIDPGLAVRPCILNPGKSWRKESRASLLGAGKIESLDEDAQKKELDRVFDILDALTRSGALPLEHVSFHVVIASYHIFDKSVIDTVVEESINPIERVERSVIITSSIIHAVSPQDMIRPNQVSRVVEFSPMLFPQTSDSFPQIR